MACQSVYCACAAAAKQNISEANNETRTIWQTKFFIAGSPSLEQFQDARKGITIFRGPELQLRHTRNSSLAPYLFFRHLNPAAHAGTVLLVSVLEDFLHLCFFQRDHHPVEVGKREGQEQHGPNLLQQ